MRRTSSPARNPLPERTSVEDLRRWHTGWRRNRGLRLVSDDGTALVARVGAPGRSEEHLVLEADEHPRRIDAAAGAAVGIPDAWVAVPTLQPGRVVDRLREHRLRIRSDSELLMSVALAEQRRTALPEGYVATVDVPSYDGSVVVHVLVHDPHGDLAASGDAGVVDDVAVPDRIETSKAHRRRGLGGAVMALVADAARDAGASRGLLVASDEGQLLYAGLGWTGHERVVIAVNG